MQCALGHVLCSPCSDKLRDAGKCHLCGVATPGGYQRCHAMERVVDSVRSPCPRAPYGCAARPVYHALQDHVLTACAHAPCHCPAAGETACGFKGSIPALLDHVVGRAHGWPCTTAARCAGGAPSASDAVRLRDGFNFIVSHDGDVDEHGRRYLYLLTVVRHPFCRAVSAVRICPRVPAAMGVKLVLSFSSYPKKRKRNGQFVGHEQKVEFRVACSDLADGLPADPDKSNQLIVSNYVLRDDDDSMIVVVEQIFPSSVRYYFLEEK